MNIQHDYFTDEAQVLAEIEAAGYHPITVDFEAETNDTHWHDFDSMVFILDGEVTITDATTGEQCVCGRGTKLAAPAGVLHNEATEGYRATIGLSCRPEEMTQPVNKPPPVALAGHQGE